MMEAPDNYQDFQHSECQTSCILQCAECNQSFKKLSALRAHSRIHMDGRPYQCVICGKCFAQGFSLKRHLSCHRVWPKGFNESLSHDPSDSLSYVCAFCTIALPNYRELRAHYKNHTNEKLYKCAQRDCSALLPTIDALLDHINSCHATVEYQCDKCLMVFSTLEELARHSQPNFSADLACVVQVETSQKKDRYKCAHCGLGFKKYDSLSRHLITSTHSYKCSICESMFMNEYGLRRHMRIHSDKKDHKCMKCSACFKTKVLLTNHSFKHDESKFFCPICNAKFKRRDIMTRHLKIHESVKKLACPFKRKGCAMEFSRSDKLKLHIKTHFNKEASALPKCIINDDDDNPTMEIIILPIN